MQAEFEQLSCQELVELVTDYLEGVLPADERLRFEEHIRPCHGCREYVEQMRTTIALSRGVERAELSGETEQALLAAFRDWKAR
jgi:anti-sigma factor RsiW